MKHYDVRNCQLSGTPDLQMNVCIYNTPKAIAFLIVFPTMSICTIRFIIDSQKNILISILTGIPAFQYLILFPITLAPYDVNTMWNNDNLCCFAIGLSPEIDVSTLLKMYFDMSLS